MAATPPATGSDAAHASDSGFHPDPPEGNVRGRVVTHDQGRFEIETVVPGP